MRKRPWGVVLLVLGGVVVGVGVAGVPSRREDAPLRVNTDALTTSTTLFATTTTTTSPTTTTESTTTTTSSRRRP